VVTGPIALFAMALDLSAYYLATLAAVHQPIYDATSLGPFLLRFFRVFFVRLSWSFSFELVFWTAHSLVCGPACYAGLL